MIPFTLSMSRPQPLRTSDFLRISQAAATAHLDRLGLTGKAEAQGLAWVIIRVRGELYAPLPETFTVQTWPGISRRGFLPRYCRILSGDTVVASMVTLWVLADAATRTLALGADLGVPEIETGYELPIPRALPKKAGAHTADFTVDPQWIDSNGHMNNCCYLDAAEQTLGLTGLPKAFSVDYRHELLPGGSAGLCCHREENRTYVTGTGETEYFRMLLEY